MFSILYSLKFITLIDRLGKHNFFMHVTDCILVEVYFQ